LKENRFFLSIVFGNSKVFGALVTSVDDRFGELQGIERKGNTEEEEIGNLYWHTGGLKYLEEQNYIHAGRSISQ
jgi:hypothetical protein